MRTQSEKATNYIANNPHVKAFIDEVNKEILKETYRGPENFLVADIGNKFIRLWSDNSCWGFISRYDGVFKGVPIKKGDLLKAASWNAPAKHSRGNIIDGTARWTVWGPTYLK